jgi:NADH:ubiquinone oxidoreductase subunit E
MTGPALAASGSQPGRDDLTARAFRALYAQFDLHTVGGTHIAVPTDTPCFVRGHLRDRRPDRMD